MTPTALFQSLWNDYIERLCPSAEKVHQLLQEDEALINDHIALRTFNVAPLGLETLAKPFLALGYQPCGEYEFKSKKLAAKHFEHPDPLQPKVFISELKVEECSPELQAIVAKLVAQVDATALAGEGFLYGGRLWSLSHA
ncbi:2-oxoadipate dioxygenase/decarboxylase family protein, partial [Vibrio metoecus]